MKYNPLKYIEWKKLKDMKEYIKEEVKRIVEKKKEGWKKEK